MKDVDYFDISITSYYDNGDNEVTNSGRFTPEQIKNTKGLGNDIIGKIVVEIFDSINDNTNKNEKSIAEDLLDIIKELAFIITRKSLQDLIYNSQMMGIKSISKMNDETMRFIFEREENEKFK